MQSNTRSTSVMETKTIQKNGTSTKSRRVGYYKSRKLFTLLAAFVALVTFQANAQTTAGGWYWIDTKSPTSDYPGTPAGSLVYPEAPADSDVEAVLDGALRYAGVGSAIVNKKGDTHTFFPRGDYGSYFRIARVSTTMTFTIQSRNPDKTVGPYLTLSYGGVTIQNFEFVQFQKGDTRYGKGVFPADKGGGKSTPGSKQYNGPYGNDDYGYEPGGYVCAPTTNANGGDSPAGGRIFVVVNQKTGELSLKTTEQIDNANTDARNDNTNTLPYYTRLWAKAYAIGGHWATIDDFKNTDFLKFGLGNQYLYACDNYDSKKYDVFRVDAVGFIQSDINATAPFDPFQTTYTSGVQSTLTYTPTQLVEEISALWKGSNIVGKWQNQAEVSSMLGLQKLNLIPSFNGKEVGTNPENNNWVLPLFTIRSADDSCKYLSVKKGNRIYSSLEVVRTAYSDLLELRNYGEYYDQSNTDPNKWHFQRINNLDKVPFLHDYFALDNTTYAGLTGARRAYYKEEVERSVKSQTFAIWIDEEGTMSIYPLGAYVYNPTLKHQNMPIGEELRRKYADNTASALTPTEKDNFYKGFQDNECLLNGYWDKHANGNSSALSFKIGTRIDGKYDMKEWFCLTPVQSIPATTYTNGLFITIKVDRPISYTVTLNKQGGSGGTSSVTVTNGSPMLSATAPTKTGYTFGGYYDQPNGNGTQYYTASMSSARNWDKTSNVTLYAKWTEIAIPTYTVNVSASPSAGGSVSGDGTYASGASCTVTATANTGYSFSNWTENGTAVSQDARYHFPVSDDRSLVANFTPISSSSTSFALAFAPSNIAFGSQTVLKLSMNNSEPIIGLQTEITVPSFVSVDLDNVSLSKRCGSSFSVIASKVSDSPKKYLFMVYSNRNQSISGNSGELINISLTIDWNNLPAQSNTGHVVTASASMVISSNSTETIAVDGVSGTFYTDNFKPGDVNQSGTVNIVDIALTMSYILGDNPQPFLFAAADMNGDGVINIADLTLIVGVILNGSSSAPAAAVFTLNAPAQGESSYELSLSNLSLNNSDVATGNLVLSMKNEMPIIGLQFDLVLPENISIATDEDGEYFASFAGRTTSSKHTIAINKLNGNVYRFIIYSNTNKTIDGTSGALLSIPVAANKMVAKGLYTVVPSVAMLTDNSYKEITPTYSSGVISINTGTGIDVIPTDNIRIYPNPVKDEIFIKSELPVTRVEIYSLTGNLVLLEDNFNGKTSVTALPQGIYLLRVYTEKGTMVRKIVKE